MQLTILNLFALGGMDSLHVSGQQQQASSKTTSRSTSPCRPKATDSHLPDHTKTLSHGSADSNKSDGVSHTHRSHHRHKSPTTSGNNTSFSNNTMDESSQQILDDTGPPETESLDHCYTSSFISNGSSELVKQTDEESDSAGTNSRLNATIEHFANKIVRVRDLIRTEQKLRDDNVNEYLKLAANADKQQVQRIKTVFEKKNQK